MTRRKDVGAEAECDKRYHYVVVTPVRDEAEHFRRTIESILSQTVRPDQWVIVNDGSSDGTAEIISALVGEYPWITPVHREDRGRREAGGAVVEVFKDGFDIVDTDEWQFIVKLDGDLSFGPDYFEICFDRFVRDRSLGIAGGTIAHKMNGEVVPEKASGPSFHVRGATKIYRRDCWEAIGGLVAMTGWDTIDEIKANMLGWRTTSFKDLILIQHRVTGAAYGAWRNAVKNGHANYVTGYHPIFMLLKCVKRLWRRPFFVEGAGLLWGYVRSQAQGLPRVKDKELICYVRREQMRRLLFRSGLYG